MPRNAKVDLRCPDLSRTDTITKPPPNFPVFLDENDIPRTWLHIHSVIPGMLYIGSRRAASDRALLSRLGVSCVINATDNIPSFFAPVDPNTGSTEVELVKHMSMPSSPSRFQRSRCVDTGRSSHVPSPLHPRKRLKRFLSLAARCSAPDVHKQDPLPARYARVPILDAPEVDILCYMHSAADMIYDELFRGGVVFVHCLAGKSRSATLVAAFLIKYGVPCCSCLASPSREVHSSLTDGVSALQLTPLDPDTDVDTQDVDTPSTHATDASELRASEHLANVARTSCKCYRFRRFEHAMRFLHVRRPVVGPNAGFLLQLFIFWRSQRNQIIWI